MMERLLNGQEEGVYRLSDEVEEGSGFSAKRAFVPCEENSAYHH